MRPKKMLESESDELTRLMNSIEKDANKRSPKYFKGSKAVQRESVEELMEMICRFSELSDNDENQHLRWIQVRFKAAIVARVFGIMDTPTFYDESGKYMNWFSRMMQQP